jgi:hypothetical protein
MTNAVHPSRWLSNLSLGRVCGGLVLSLLLLFAQHGALLHELSHVAAPQPQDAGEKQRSAGHPCELCLAFAQVDSTATSDVAVPALLAGLSFVSIAAPASTLVAAELPSLRNRGPPAAL